MRRIALLLLFISSFTGATAQTSISDLVKEINRTITIYSTDNAAPLTIYEPIGTIEQKKNESSSQRFKLSEIGSILVEKNESGFTVNIHCADSSRCMSLIKNDMSTSMMPSDAFFFNDARAANTFAKRLEELIAKYPSDRKPVQAQLLKVKEAIENAPSNEKSTDVTSPQKTTPPNKKKHEEDDDQEADDQEAKKEKSAVREKNAPLTEAEAKERAINRRKQKEDADADHAEERENKKAASKDNEAADNNATQEVTEPVCKQLLAIIKAGKDSRFKDIEGKETNPSTKINESKLKLKGAKRSYLSWYKKERTFIAEYKTLIDHELILIEFEKLQTELEDCLEGGWEDIDHSSDEMYANVSEEVKDVEYKFTSDPARPSLRIMINTDQSKRYTLFVRIQ
jgi:flagellar biosynthesis GTPase FlhF